MAKQNQANADDERIYLVTIRGAYFAKGVASGSREKQYQVTLEMTKRETKDNPVMLFRNGFENYMKFKYPDFESLATHELVSTVPKDGGVIDDFNLLNYPELKVLIAREPMLSAIDPTLYFSVDELRQAVLDCLDDEAGFKTQQAIKRSITDPSKQKGLTAEQRNLPLIIKEISENSDLENVQINEIAPLNVLIRTKEMNARMQNLEMDIKDIDQIGNLKDDDNVDKVQSIIDNGGHVVRDRISKDKVERQTRAGKPLTNLGV